MLCTLGTIGWQIPSAIVSTITTKLWLDSSDLSTLFQNTTGTMPVTTNGQTVQRWSDKSANMLAFSTAGSQHTYQSNGLNGRACVRATGAEGTGMQITTNSNTLPLAGQDSTVFIVAKHETTKSGIIFIYGSERRLWSYWPETNGVSNGVQFRNDCVGVPLVLHDTSTALDTNGHVISSAHPVGSCSGWMDGAPFSPTATAPRTWTNTTGGSARLFVFSNGYSYPMQGAIAEIIIANETLGTKDRQAIEGYLAWKWNAVSYLPSDHPWKSAAPTVAIS